MGLLGSVCRRLSECGERRHEIDENEQAITNFHVHQADITLMRWSLTPEHFLF